MSQVIQCPACYSSLSLGDENVGQTVRCPQCQASFVATPPVSGPAASGQSAPGAWGERSSSQGRGYGGNERRERADRVTRLARAAVSGPATGLFVTSILSLVGAAGFLALGVFFIIMIFVTPPAHNEWGIVMGCLASSFGPGVSGMVWGMLVLVGARKMQHLTSRGWALTAAYLSLVPCYCLIPALPLGIWALTALNKPEVKEAFAEA